MADAKHHKTRVEPELIRRMEVFIVWLLRYVPTERPGLAQRQEAYQLSAPQPLEAVVDGDPARSPRIAGGRRRRSPGPAVWGASQSMPAG